jgi:glycosyltransferase involved in cell wall biosynthesis
MKILFITPQFPYPLDNGGKIGAYNGICVASKNNDVTVLSFTEESQYVKEGIDFFHNKLPNVFFEEPVFHSIHIRKKIFKLFCAMFLSYIKRIPYIVSKFENRKMYRKIDEMFKKNDLWDIVFIDYLNMNKYGKYIKNRYNKQVKHFILKDHNIEYELAKQECLSSNGIKKLVLNYEWKRTYKYERYAIENSELVFSVCDENTNEFRKYNSNVWTMFPTYEMLPTKKKKYNKKILYIGNLSWKSNMDGLNWFVNDVFPILKKSISEITLTIVGGGCENNPFKDIVGIEYLGYVKDISNIYDNYSVFIVPLKEGSGIRIKILEAFNNEIAVVSTTLGCDTIGAESDKEIMIADTNEDFADAIIKLLNNKQFNEKICKQAKQLLMNKFSLDARQEEFKQILSKTFKE